MGKRNKKSTFLHWDVPFSWCWLFLHFTTCSFISVSLKSLLKWTPCRTFFFCFIALKAKSSYPPKCDHLVCFIDKSNSGYMYFSNKCSLFWCGLSRGKFIVLCCPEDMLSMYWSPSHILKRTFMLWEMTLGL